MTSLKKKLTLLFISTCAAACAGAGIMLMPKPSSAAGEVTLSGSAYFNVSGGKFTGLTQAGINEVGSKKFKIELPDTVTAIGTGYSEDSPTQNALFGRLASNLVGVSFKGADKLVTIEKYAFNGCTSLETIPLEGEKNLTTVEEGAFRGCTSLTNISLPKVSTIAKDLFSGCTTLRTFTTSNNSIVTIADGAFENCYNLNSVTIPDNLETIGISAFANCRNLTPLILPDSAVNIGAHAFSGCAKLESVRISDSVTQLNEGVFYNCTSLKRIYTDKADTTSVFKLPSGIVHIGKNAFNGCIALTEITVPKTVTTINERAFYSCSGVSDIYFYATASNLSVANQQGTFALAPNAQAYTDVTVHIGSQDSAVENLPPYLFAGHTGIKEIHFDNVSFPNVEDSKNFGTGAFQGCKALEKIVFGADSVVKSIGQSAFADCTSLVVIEGIENTGLNTIKQQAFSNCSSLRTFTIGADVNNIQDNAFANCRKLVEVKNLSANSALQNLTAGSNNFGLVAYYALRVYKDGDSNIDAEKHPGFVFYADSSKNWLIDYTGEGGEVTLPGGYGASVGGAQYDIHHDAFLGKTEVTHVVIPDTAQIKKIEDSAFAQCTSLTHITFPSTLLEVGDNLLQGCTSLTNVNFNSNVNINTISSYMFQGCTSLESITLPQNIRTIDYSAFADCSNLKTVTFGGGLTGSNKKDVLVNINGSSFKNCSSLEVVEFPSTVKSVGQSAFEGCNKLQFVYLSEDATYGADAFKTGTVDSSDTPLMLISKSKDSYDADMLKNNLSAYSENLTYIIAVNLIYDDGAVGGVHTVPKLYNRSAGYEQIGLKWNQSASMPSQGKDFVESVWYKTDAYDIKDKVDLDELTKMLADGGEISLYARYITQPKLTVLNPDVQFSEDKSYDIKGIFTELLREITGNPSDVGTIDEAKFEEYASKFTFNVVSHKFVDGTDNTGFDWANDGYVRDAGTYVLEIKLKSDYGIWATPCNVTFKINPKNQDISKLVVWQTESGNLGPSYTYDGNMPSSAQLDAMSTELYFFGGGTTPYLEKGSQTPSEQIKVLRSYVAYKNAAEIEIMIRWQGGISYGSVVDGSYTGNKALEAGSYEASALIKPDNNYRLIFTEDALTQRLGLTFSRADDGMVTVTKKWYIVMDKNNRLTVSDSDTSDYAFEIRKDDKVVDWVYTYDTKNAVEPPKAPSVLYGQSGQLLSFSLRYDGKMITGKMPDGTNNTDKDGKIRLTNQAVFSHYINSSLPAGDYVLIFYIDPFNDGDQTISGNSEGYVFEFTVKEATVTKMDRNNVINSLINTKIEYTGEVTFIDTSTLELFKKGKGVQYNQGVGIGVWKNYPEYYTAFEARYFVAEAGKDYADKNYYTAKEYEEAYAEGVNDRAIPVNLGTYTVYYIVDAPNYEGEITGQYVLNITHTLKKITIDEIEYTGVSVLPDVDALLRKGNSEIFDEYSFFDVFTLSPSSIGSTPANLFSKYGKPQGDTYTDLGLHVVFVSVKEIYKEYVLWDSSISENEFDFGTAVVYRKFLPVQFNIAASHNRETPDGKLFINSWEYGKFTREDNAPHWKLMISDDYSRYKFELISEDKTAIYYFNGDPDAQLSGPGFNYAPAGRYTLKAIDPGAPDDGVGEFVSEIEIEVGKAELFFNEVPFIDSWNYGNTPSNIGLPDLTTALGGLGSEVASKVKIYYCLKADYDRPSGVPTLYETLDGLKDKSGHVGAGEYYVILRLDEQDNFSVWEYKIRFKVLPATNSWKSLYIPDFDYIDFDDAMKLMEAVPNYGEASKVVIQYKKKGTQGTFQTIDKLLNIEGKLDIGTYEMRALLSQSENYARLETVTTFTVSRAQNAWVEVPYIRGWAEGNFSAEKNSVIASSALGAVKIIITDANGREYGTHELSSLGIGTYKLTARVEGTNNYDELESEIYFDVIEDSVGLTALIASTVVFSVLALCLAGAAITLLILRNKKAEREYRKAVRNELRRK